MVTSFTDLILAFMVGMGTGTFYFGGLFWTVRRIPRSKNPTALMIASFVFRTAVAVACLFLIMGSTWQPIAVSLLGFITIRMVIVERLKPAKTARTN
jgi:F1F0 ATPase subunit 2